MTDSILNSTKKLLGILPEDSTFDADILTHINSVFMILHQLGVGTDTVFSVSDSDTEWSEFVQDENSVSLVKTYIYLKVRMLFDPPQTAGLMSSMERLTAESEHRLVIQVDELSE